LGSKLAEADRITEAKAQQSQTQAVNIEPKEVSIGTEFLSIEIRIAIKVAALIIQFSVTLKIFINIRPNFLSIYCTINLW